MRRFAISLGAAAVIAVLPLAAQAPAAEDELVVKARQFLTALKKNDFQAAVKDFDETMKKVMGPDKLAQFWSQIPRQLSPFKRQTAARRGEPIGPYDVVFVTCEFETTTVDARLVFNKAKQIAGLQFVPSLPPAKYDPPEYADPAMFEERDVTVGRDPWTLPGTLTLPKGAGPFPVVVLVHGSGPNDRDETVGPNKTFKDVAWGLASRGVAVLRYEKRTRVYGPKFADKKFVSGFTVKEETIDDALEAVRILKTMEKVDARKIFVLGHSLGGMLIPRIGVAGEDLGIAGFIIMAGLTLPIEDTMLDQFTYLYRLDGSLSADETKKLEDLKAQIAKIKALTPADAASEERILNATPAYWLDLRGYSPTDVVQTLRQPMLVLQGSRDYQVTPRNFENWKKALGSRTDVVFKLYPNLNHLFLEGQGVPNPDEYTLIHRSVAKAVVSDIAAFIKKN